MFCYDAATGPGSDLDAWNLQLNEIDPRTLSGTSKEITTAHRPFIDPRTGRVIEHLEVSWTRPEKKSQLQLFMNFPERSHLTRKQHMNGLKALASLKKKIPSEAEHIAIMEYENDKPKITEDHQKFHSFVKQYVEARLRERFTKPCKSIAELGELVTRSDPTKYQDCLYSIQTGVQLKDPRDEFISDTQLILTEDLKAFGIVKTIHFVSETPMVGVLPKSETSAKQFLQKDPDITRNYNAYVGGMGRQFGGIFLNTQTIYQIISAEIGSSWTIPFLVQGSDSSEPFVFFESPFQKPSCLSALELEQFGLEICYQAALTKCYYRSYSFDEEKYIDKLVGSGEDTSKIESDGEGDEDEETRLVIDSVPENEIVEKPIDESVEPEKSPEEFKVFEYDEYLSKLSTNAPREPLNYIVSRVSLKSSPSDPEPIPLIITSSCDGLYRSENVTLSFKFEFKTEFGAQTMSLEELIKEWCSIAFSSRINHVVRVRIDYPTSIIMSVSYLNQEEIETEMHRLYGLKPERLLTRLYNVLKLVTQFPVGKYLLDKDQNNAQILVYMETERSDCGKMWKDLMAATALSAPPSRPAFVELPIDDQVVTQLHRMNCVLPACIPALTKSQVAEFRQKHIEKKQATQNKAKGRFKGPAVGKRPYKKGNNWNRKRKNNVTPH